MQRDRRTASFGERDRRRFGRGSGRGAVGRDGAERRSEREPRSIRGERCWVVVVVCIADVVVGFERGWER